MRGRHLFKLSFVLVDNARSTGVDRFQMFTKVLLRIFMYNYSQDGIECWTRRPGSFCYYIVRASLCFQSMHSSYMALDS